jgi:hypothetical protein
LSAAGIGGGLTSLPGATASEAAAHAKFRPDIDGVRAVAIAEQLRQDGIGYVSLHAALCPDSKCRWRSTTDI